MCLILLLKVGLEQTNWLLPLIAQQLSAPPPSLTPNTSEGEREAGRRARKAAELW